MARIECGFTCKDCLSFEKCSYDAYKEANLNGKSEQNLISIADRLPCKFFKNKEDYEKVRYGEWLPDYETFVDDSERESEPIQTGWVCSLCGRQEFQKEPYCHCGAKMNER